MEDGFPIVTSKYVNYPAVVDELLWFLSGSTNIKDLKFTKIWDDWADANGNLGPIYSHQWRNLEEDQIAELLHNIILYPESRRLVVSAWNVDQLKHMSLMPCHYSFECFVSEGCLDLKWHQRSVDLMLGLPFNIASYATLLHMLAKAADLTPRYLIGDLGNCHIYTNHIKAAIKQLDQDIYALPTLSFPRKNIFEYEIEDFKLINYFHGPKIKLEVAV